MDTSPHVSDFVSVNGVRLHYLDWGGAGPALLFLAGLGCSAHIFDRFAPRFTDRFHVLALTRRGHGESDYPDTGYDIDTLTDDIRCFMDTLKIEQAVLVGHSLAGIELSRFATLHPTRVLKLVYLDAAYDYASPNFKAMLAKNPVPRLQPADANAEHYALEDYKASLKRCYPALAIMWNEVLDTEMMHSVKFTPEGKVVERMSDAISQALRDTLNNYSPEIAKISAPMLSFFVNANGTDYLSDAFMSAEQQAEVLEFFATVRRPFNQEWIEQFRRAVPHARIVELSDGHHYCFIMQEKCVLNAMRSFLLTE
ncbi:MAG: alpha/beta hydrolase [Anaerolineae bacterium]